MWGAYARKIHKFLCTWFLRRLNHGSFVFLFFMLFALSDLYLVFACLFSCTVFVCLFSCTALFVSISQVIGCEDRLRNDLYCVGWGVKLCSTNWFLSYLGQLILRKIIEIVATRCRILRLKYTKYDFGWGSTPDPTGGAHNAPPNP